VKNHLATQMNLPVLMAAIILMSVAQYVSVHVRQDIAELIVPRLRVRVKLAQAIVIIMEHLISTGQHALAIVFHLILDLPVNLNV
jgi:hypothetical protein